MSFLEVKDLRVGFPTDDGLVQAVDGVSFSVERGRTLGIVGESGSGKSVTSLAVMGLLNRRRTKITGEVLVGGDELISAADETVRKHRGSDMAMIFQDPMSSLHPFFSIGDQVAEAYLVHNQVSKQNAWDKAVQMLDRVGIPEAGKKDKDGVAWFGEGLETETLADMRAVVPGKTSGVF
jgi:peptide/nickel transport system ATP-binding protein